MKKYFFLLGLAGFFCTAAFSQSGSNIFSSVPVTNGKVVFQQFIHASQNLQDDQKYAILSKWGKDNFSGNPSLLSLRFDEKTKSITVSAKTDLSLPANKANASKAAMTYRFDASISNMGCMLVIRDISYQLPSGNSSGFSKPMLAENVITDNAINSATDDAKDLNNAVKKSTLLFFNQLYGKLNSVFE